VEFQDISFGYDKNKPVLHEISFRVAAGQSVGLIGPSGSGKTTLLNLLPRFYDADTGAILIEGINIREIRLEELRQNIAYVFQEPFLLPGTIAENIAVGNEQAAREKIVESARLANAHNFIERLPKGYDTIVGEGAARLSVGEKQRISIARAFLKNAPILLLDEPTSSLDIETEEMIVESLKQLAKNRTTFVAAHRFTTLQNIDRVVVLENGRVIESGTPNELAGIEGYYSRMLRLGSSLRVELS
jgi:ABC-type multidrug transport system fused ATPase/permease subunit